MKTRHGLQWGCLVCGLLAFPAAAPAQEQAGDASGNESAAAADESSPGKATAPPLGVPAGDRQDAARAGGDPAPDQPASPAAGDAPQDLPSLRESHALLQQEVDVLRSEVRRLSDRLGELTAPGGAAPRNLLGQMAVDEDFRRDVMRAIQGEVVIHNRTSSSHSFFVNGVCWSVPPGKYVVWVPLGDVTAHLADEPPLEFSDHWKLIRDKETGEPQHYRLWLNIGNPEPNEPVPAKGVVARR